MELHNTNEDVVIAQVNDIFDFFDKNESSDGICTCEQCRMDTACFVLNRIEPRYIVSNRGAVRIEQESIANQQKEADIVAMIHEGIKRVNHNKRSSSDHAANVNSRIDGDTPTFNIPTMIGRLFDGANFAPISDVKVELHRDGILVPMVDSNWQNPYHLIQHSEGTFTFWPAPIPAEAANIHTSFEFSVTVKAPGFEELNHFFKIPVISEIRNVIAFSRDRTFKLPDLYIFPPGGNEYL
jgi:competence protein ComFB